MKQKVNFKTIIIIVEKRRIGVNLHEFEQLSERAVDLIFNNKINAKNAFDVNVEYLENLPHLLKRNEETSWQKASASLDASAKIYGYRVDSVHSETFKFLGGLSRADKEEKNEGENEEDRKKRAREGRHDGFSTLETNHKKLDLVKYDLEFEVDPLFKSMTAKFGDSGARGLLLKTLPLDCDMNVFLESKEREVEKEISKENENLSQNSNINSKKCPTEILSIIETTVSSLSVTELKSLQICPDLNYFKKARELETSLEKTFYNNLMTEFDETRLKEGILNDRSQLSESFDNSINYDNAENENQENFSHSQRSSLGSNHSHNFEDNMNMNMINIKDFGNELAKMGGVSYMEGFSYIKSDEIKEYIHQFGDGNKEIFKNIPQYKNFTKSFGQLEKLNNFGSGIGKLISENGDNLKKEKRTKKEEVLFDFSEENEVKRCDIFEKESKTKRNLGLKEAKVKNQKKKVRQYYHYDRSILFNLFSVGDRLINDATSTEIVREVNNYDATSEPDDVQLEEERSNYNETFIKIDSEYEKKFGRLYKTFDVRMIKSKIWESISNLKEKEQPTIIEQNKTVNFKQVINSIQSNMSKEVLNNISTSTCFVCLLHLSNEKNLILEDVDGKNFTIKKEN